ncbi:hypothetical protein [Streptomyces sioyaensis]|uniref:hypothetical protein n=1 Tax=Streptomyces sioyaensis TaxID=67364 RepID=UPI0037897118
MGLAHLHVLGADLDVDLAGRRLPTPRRMAKHRSGARWWINWQWRGYSCIPHCVPGGRAWLEVVQLVQLRWQITAEDPGAEVSTRVL